MSSEKQTDRFSVRFNGEDDSGGRMSLGHPDFVFNLNKDGIIQNYSVLNHEALFPDPERYLGRPLTELLPAGIGGKAEDGLRQIRKSGNPVHFCYQISKDGTENHHEAQLIPQRDDEVIVLIRDVSEQRKVQQEIERRERLFSMVLAHVPLILLAMDVSGTITLFDGRGLQNLEIDRLKFLGMDAFQKISEYPTLTEMLKRALAGESFIETIDVIPDHLYEVRFAPIRDNDGTLIGVIAVAVEITDRVDLEQQLLQAQKMEVAGRLAGGIAHDFNNLLTIIMLNIDQLFEIIPDGEHSHNLIRIIERATQRATNLINRLLTFSRKQIIEPRPIDLGAMLHELHHILQQLLGENINLKFLFGEEQYSVRADPGQMEQIVLNLIVNSRDAMPLGGVLAVKLENIKIDQEFARKHLDVAPGEYVLLAIRDTGSGITEGDLPHIFEPFFTTKEPGKGTGLGLSTVYGIVKQNGGFIDISSQTGKGTIVQIYLPLVEITEETEESLPEQLRPLRDLMTILLVEDEDDVRNSLKIILQRHNYAVLEARQGEEALVMGELHQGSIDLLITDVVLPGISGPELARLILDRRPAIRVLYISGYPASAIEQHGVTEGSRVLQKPFKPAQLIRKLQEIFDT